MAEFWYPGAVRNVASVDGGTHLGPVEIGVLHTTEGEFTPRPKDYYGHTSYPHLTADVDDGKFIAYQHIPLNRAARALENRSGGVQTNREGVIQIEVVGRAAEPFTQDPVMVAGLRDLMRWVEANTQIPRRAAATFWTGKYGVNVPYRLSGEQWVAAKGWLGHQHVAENAHYDPGAIDIGLLLRMPTTTVLEEDDGMKLIRNETEGSALYGKVALIGGPRRPVESVDNPEVAGALAAALGMKNINAREFDLVVAHLGGLS